MAVTPTYGKLSVEEVIYPDRVRPMWTITDLQPHLAIRLKQIFPRIPKSSRGPFHLPVDKIHAADLAWFTSRYALEISPEHAAMLESGKQLYESVRADMERILLPEYKPGEIKGLKEGQEIRFYQAQAVELLRGAHGLLLGDEVGLGKSYAAAAACLLAECRPAAIVCQPHLQKQWIYVLQRFTNLKVHAISSTRPYKFPQADVVIFRYTQLQGWVDTFEPLGFNMVVFDEIQELRTGVKSSKGKCAKELADLCSYRLGLSATPIYNYGGEIWNVMQYVRPEVLGDFEDFTREYCTWIGQDKWSIKDPKALGSYLRAEHAFLRRTKADVGKQMPAVNKIVEEISYDHEAVKSAEELARTLAIKATTGAFMERGMAARELDILMRQATGVAKAKHVADFVRMAVEGGEPVILVGWHRDVYDIWMERLRDLEPAMFTGSETAKQKEEAKRRFLDGETDIMIMSLRSGAGVDGLQHRCSTMIFGELDWSPGIHHQCIGRIDREGQTLPVTAIYLVVDEGSDPPLMQVLGLKASEAAELLDPSLGVQASHSDRSAIQSLVDRYLSKR